MTPARPDSGLAPLKSGDLISPSVRLLRPLAEGGMGRVWVAEHLGLRTEVVVKTMSEEMFDRADARERFEREAAAAAAIKSPNVVQVFDHGRTEAGIPYIVMELLEGKDLGAKLADEGPQSPAFVMDVVVQVGRALSKAHKAGVVHRDIKPENIFLCEPDSEQEGAPLLVKLLDFGTAKRELPTSSRTTVPGLIMGTPYYMSPEQSVGSDIDERSDIWSLGVVAFEALTGRKPFDGHSVGAITIAIHGAFPRISDILPALGPGYDEWFARACAQETDKRFQSVREATNAFVECVTGAAPPDMPTESLFFPPVVQKDSTPPRPVVSTVKPLTATLPDRAKERRPTTIAFAAVASVAVIAMAAIVVHRPSSPSPSAPEVAQAAPPPAAPPPAAVTPSAPLGAINAAEPAPAKHAGKPVPAPPPEKHASGAKHTASAKAPPKKGSSAAAPKTPNAKGSAERPGVDDDLAKLQRAAAEHEAPPAAPAAPPPPELPKD